MKTLLRNLLFLVGLLALGSAAFSGDQEDAEKAAGEVLSSLQSRNYEKLWNTQMSAFFKSRVTKDSFLANMTMGRQQLGSPGESRFLDMAYSKSDPASGIKGEIYAFNYLNAYAAGRFYERIVMIKEQDGKFRLAGLWGSPAGK